MKTQYKEFLDDLAKVFKKHKVSNMIAVDENGDCEGELDIRFTVNCDDIRVNNFYLGRFVDLTTSDDYIPNIKDDENEV